MAMQTDREKDRQTEALQWQCRQTASALILHCVTMETQGHVPHQPGSKLGLAAVQNSYKYKCQKCKMSLDSGLNYLTPPSTQTDSFFLLEFESVLDASTVDYYLSDNSMCTSTNHAGSPLLRMFFTFQTAFLTVQAHAFLDS